MMDRLDYILMMLKEEAASLNRIHDILYTCDHDNSLDSVDLSGEIFLIKNSAKRLTIAAQYLAKRSDD